MHPRCATDNRAARAERVPAAPGTREQMRVPEAQPRATDQGGR
jgi:hypothetical protein